MTLVFISKLFLRPFAPLWVGNAAVVLAALAMPTAHAQSAAQGTAPRATSVKAATPTHKGSVQSFAPSCSWDRPGKNPYMGELPAAVDRYTDLSPEVRAKLKDRIAKQQYDDMVVIKRDSIEGGGNFIYATDIRGMHFGANGRVCDAVTRKNWQPTMTERGLVYCEAGQCLMVPTVCRNVSRVSRKPHDVAAAKADSPAAAAPAPAAMPVASAPAAPLAKAEAPTVVGAPTAPAFTDVAQGPVFAFPIGPSGSSGVTIAPPTGGGGGGGGGGGAVGGTGGSNPGGTVGGTPIDVGTTTPTSPAGPGGTVAPTVVTPVPEPSTWVLMILGLLAVGLASRRKGKQAA